MSEQTANRVRVRWGWFVACIVLGIAAILLGWIAWAASGYFAGVLANAGTTLLLVGVVLLLERRIIDTAVSVVRQANERTDAALRAQIGELDARIAAVWESTTVENIAEKSAETERITEEFTKRVVRDATREAAD